jgi:hypothetical protein
MTSSTARADNPHHPGKPFFPCRPAGLDEVGAEPYAYRTEAVLPCSPAALLDVFEDPKSWPVWAVGIKKVEWTSPQPYGVGTTRTVTFADGTEVYERFIAWERGREMAFVLEGLTNPIFESFGERYTVRDVGGGRCHLVWTVVYAPGGGFARAHPWVKPAMRLAFKLYLYRLRRYVEKGSRGQGAKG